MYKILVINYQMGLGKKLFLEIRATGEAIRI
jgi:hypothetical protein